MKTSRSSDGRQYALLNTFGEDSYREEGMMASLRPSISLLLACLLCIPGSLVAQQAPGTPAAQPDTGSGLPPAPLRILVLEGKDGQNSIPLGRSVTPIVEVRDDRDRVVEGATVEFKLPVSGPGGTFPGNRTFFSMRTNGQGQAAAPFIVNNIPGRFEIQVTATFGNREGRATIRQVNANDTFVGQVAPKPPILKRWTTWAIVGAAAGVGLGLYFGLRGDESSSSVVIRPGGPVVGGPR